jgi:hypothetical protein
LAAITATLAALMPLAAYGAPAKLTVTVPDCVITRAGGYDLVEIAGGGTLMEEEGRPLVPYYVIKENYPPGERVQEVSLVGKSRVKTFTGLVLPAAAFEEYPRAPVGMKGGWYPEREYDWQVLDEAEGRTTLELVIYPFFYNPDTGEAYFFKQYDFEVSASAAEISFSRVLLNGGLYRPGDTVAFELWLTNAGAAQDTVIGLEIRRFGTAGMADSLPLRLLKNVQGQFSCALSWPSPADCDGDYYAEITVYGASGEVMDRINSRPITFSADAPQVSMEPITMEPSPLPLLDLWDRYKTAVMVTGGCLILLIILVAIVRAAGKK